MFSSEQAIIIPLPGDDSKRVSSVVSTTNKVLANMRKLFCGNHGDGRTVAVAIFENQMFHLQQIPKNSRQPCVPGQMFHEDELDRSWKSQSEGDPLYKSAPPSVQKIMKEVWWDIHLGMRDFFTATCTGGPANDPTSQFSRDDSIKLLQDLYDALCPLNKHILKPTKLTADNTPQLMISLFGIAAMTTDFSHDEKGGSPPPPPPPPLGNSTGGTRRPLGVDADAVVPLGPGSVASPASPPGLDPVMTSDFSDRPLSG